MIGAAPISLQNVIPSYLFSQYTDDDGLQAQRLAYNQVAQSYLDWFNQINLPVYTGLSGSLLDWVATGLYGLPRPLIPTQAGPGVGLFDTVEYNQIEYNQYFVAQNQTFYTVSDDLYKRILTWRFYRGDGPQFTIPWLKKRVKRFLVGVNGTSAPIGTQTINGLVLPANLVDLRSTPGNYVNEDGSLGQATANTPRVDWSTGTPVFLVEGATTNQLYNSELIGGPHWLLSGGTEVFLGQATIQAPDLSYNATMLTETASATQHLITNLNINNPGVGTIETASVYAAPKSGVGTLFMTNYGESSAVFDLINGVAPVPAGTVIATGMQPMMGGWWRCWTTWKKQNAHSEMYLGTGSTSALNYVGDPNNQIYLWGAQREFGYLSSYIKSTSVVGVRDADVISYPEWVDETDDVSVTFTGSNNVTIKVNGYATLKAILSAAIASGVLPLPPMYTFTVE